MPYRKRPPESEIREAIRLLEQALAICEREITSRDPSVTPVPIRNLEEVAGWLSGLLTEPRGGREWFPRWLREIEQLWAAVLTIVIIALIIFRATSAGEKALLYWKG